MEEMRNEDLRRRRRRIEDENLEKGKKKRSLELSSGRVSYSIICHLNWRGTIAQIVVFPAVSRF